MITSCFLFLLYPICAL